MSNHKIQRTINKKGSLKGKHDKDIFIKIMTREIEELSRSNKSQK